MAAPVLKAELKHKDGKTTTFTVAAENNLKSLITGVKQLNSDISVVLTSLVEEEKRLKGDKGDSHVDAEEEEEEEDDEGEDATETAAVKSKSGPPPKRLKTVTQL